MERDEQPMYLEQLTEDDKLRFAELKEAIGKTVATSGRAKFCSIFGDIVAKIRSFVVRGYPERDNIRSLVCGIIWMDNNIIAINTRQLILTMSKCKSSINSGFQAIGYKTVAMDPQTVVGLVHKFPFMKQNFCETRQWTLRKLATKAQVIQENESIEDLVSNHVFVTPPPLDDLFKPENGFELFANSMNDSLSCIDDMSLAFI